MKRSVWLPCLFLVAFPLGLPARGQDRPLAAGPGHPKVDQARVDQAIRKGVDYLRTKIPDLKTLRNGHVPNMCPDELVLLTLAHAGVPESDPDFQKLLQKALTRDLERTYCVSLQAMVLEEVDRVRYQSRLVQCAQFLVDNQCQTGQWSYGSPSAYALDVPSEDRKKATASGAKGTPVPLPTDGRRPKPAVVRRIPVKKMREGGVRGDNSNSQYAALGLRACHEAGVILPADVVDRAAKWWKGSQKPEPGAKAEKLELDGPPPGKPSAKGSTTTRPALLVEPQGWCYSDNANHGSYGSMTAGAIGALAIYDYIRDAKSMSWKTNADIHEGLQWLAKNWSVTYNPGPYASPKGANENTTLRHYYYLYAIERLGMLYGTERIGNHEWYPEGAAILLGAQKPDGSWPNSIEELDGETLDTCFAILFLRRGTQPLGVASVDRYAERKK